jgi:hypothetical protein
MIARVIMLRRLRSRRSYISDGGINESRLCITETDYHQPWDSVQKYAASKESKQSPEQGGATICALLGLWFG